MRHNSRKMSKVISWHIAAFSYLTLYKEHMFFYLLSRRWGPVYTWCELSTVELYVLLYAPCWGILVIMLRAGRADVHQRRKVSCRVVNRFFTSTNEDITFHHDIHKRPRWNYELFIQELMIFIYCVSDLHYSS